jgi:hypothetical protein
LAVEFTNALRGAFENTKWAALPKYPKKTGKRISSKPLARSKSNKPMTARAKQAQNVAPVAKRLAPIIHFLALSRSISDDSTIIGAEWLIGFGSARYQATAAHRFWSTTNMIERFSNRGSQQRGNCRVWLIAVMFSGGYSQMGVQREYVSANAKRSGTAPPAGSLGVALNDGTCARVGAASQSVWVPHVLMPNLKM